MLCAVQFLDGPYKTFLASVKLEGAYRRISQGLPFPQEDTKAKERRPKRQEKRQHTQQQHVKDASDQDGSNGSSKPSAPFELTPHQRQKQQQQQQKTKSAAPVRGQTAACAQAPPQAEYPAMPAVGTTAADAVGAAAVYAVGAATVSAVGATAVARDQLEPTLPDQAQVYTQAWDD
jgi:hypothetical protein